jgi:RimJ/RimL family protein N-acetyltransferase
MSRPIRLPESLSDGVILLDGHTLDDARAHRDGEDEEMRRRFGAPRRSTLDDAQAAMRRWIDGRAAGEPMFAYALRLPSRQLMGGCEVRWLAQGSLNVSYWLYPRFRGKGHASRALALLCQAVVAMPGVRQIEAHVEADNDASRRVAERAGFTPDGNVVEDGQSGEKIARIRYVRTLA